MQITIFFILIMIVATVLVARHGALSKLLKGFVISLFLLTIVLATLFEYGSSGKAQSRQALVMAFKQGTPLLCNGTIITKEAYLYESGTASFQPNHTVGKTYSIKECTIDQ